MLQRYPDPWRSWCFILLHCLVSVLDLVPYPAAEETLEYCSANVTNPRFLDFVDLLLVRKIIEDFLVAIVEESSNILEGKSFIMRNRNMSNFFCFNTYLLTDSALIIKKRYTYTSSSLLLCLSRNKLRLIRSWANKRPRQLTEKNRPPSCS